ncbi:hypothetical protein BLA29_009705 [Euroglyphus maynei]|uniref:Transmembrane protein n=1 Tax=Euroglyphus maynei TaxID=6958 RepID=A0A1Y3B2Q4_EURMA|nr:hypothetical protein BLA29_009705 [Euroglyphus maynei]
MKMPKPKAKNILQKFFNSIITMTQTEQIVKPYVFTLKKWSTILLNLINLIVLSWLVINLILTSNYFGKLDQKSSMNSTKSIRQYNYAIFSYMDYYDQQQQQQSDEDFNQLLTEFYTNITEIIIDLIGLVAVIKEHYHLSLIYIVLGMINLIGTIVMYTEMQTYETLIQMILTIVFYTVLLFYVNDLMKIQKQRKQREEEQQQQI